MYLVQTHFGRTAYCLKLKRVVRIVTTDKYIYQIRSRNSSVVIAMCYGLDGQSSNPGRGKTFLFSTTSILILEPAKVPRALSPEVKRPGCEADHSPPSSAEVKNGGTIPPLHVLMA
jgi:hypothetical protein